VFSRAERAILVAWAGAVALLHVAFAVGYRVDTDETQHLHVVWAWVHGLVQYRDVFDNHAPLFHVLFAPVLAMFGERADIVVWMRLAQIPLALTMVVSIYLLACTVVPERTAVWVAAVAALDPLFVPRTVEFRTDNLWTVGWLVSLAVLLRGSLSGRRLLLFGLLLGATFAASLKTVMLVAGGGIAGIAPQTWSRGASLRERLVRLAAAVPLVLAGALVVPGVFLAWFASRGALEPLYYCLVEHNAQAHASVTVRAAVIIPVALVLVLLASPLVASWIARSGRETRATFLVASGFTYLVLLWCLWPIVTRQDYMPVQSLLALLAVPLLARLGAGWRPVYALLAIEAVLLLLAIPPVHPWSHGPQREAALIGDVIRLTDPADTIIDLKGETVYRRRASYYVLEAITRQLLASGRLPDDAPERLVSERTFAAVDDDGNFPPRTREFLNGHYIPAGHLRVAGAMLNPAVEGTAESFEIAIPGEYAFVTSHGLAAGTLDGRRVYTAIDLAAGHHVFVLEGKPQSIAVLWARAWQRGFTPFAGGVRPLG